MIEITTYEYADVSTTHITKRDGELILDPRAPGSLAILHDGEGAFFRVHEFGVQGAAAEQTRASRAFGFSDAFCAIFDALREQGVAYVRFDADGGLCPDLPTFQW